MQDDALRYLEFIDSEEARQATALRRMGLFATGMLIAGVLAIQGGYDAVVVGSAMAAILTVFTVSYTHLTLPTKA